MITDICLNRQWRKAHTDSPVSTLSRTAHGCHCEISSAVLLHSSRSETVCTPNDICILESCSSFTKILYILIKQQAMDINLLMKSDRDLRHTIQVEKHSGKGRRRLGVQASWEYYHAVPTISLPRWRRRASCLRFSMVYTASQISSVSTSSDSLKTTVSSRQIC